MEHGLTPHWTTLETNEESVRLGTKQNDTGIHGLSKSLRQPFLLGKKEKQKGNTV